MTEQQTGQGVMTRTLVLWCPDWPVTATVRSLQLDATAPIALIDRGTVYACSAAARVEGVSRGLRLREAQARCPSLLVLPYDPLLDMRSFDSVVTEIEQIMPGVQLLRPGTAALRVRGPAQYYGGETPAAIALIGRLADLTIADARVGVADGPFTAEQAARSTGWAGAAKSAPGGKGAIRIVPEGGSAQFLGPLPVSLLQDAPLATLLRRLGVHSLADFAALRPADVLERFGPGGAQLHALAGGRDSRPVVVRTPPEELDVAVDFEPPLERIDQIAFGVRAVADDFIQGLAHAGLVCTALRIELRTETAEVSERSWLHPRSFTATEVVDRVRWQLQGGDAQQAGLSSRIENVRIIPESVDAVSNHEQGLWGNGPDERVHHGLSRVQGMLGHAAVLTATVGGGRSLSDRQVFVPWGDKTLSTRGVTQPWPGQVPPPLPSTVFPAPRPVLVLASGGGSVQVDERGALSGAPSDFSATGTTLAPVRAWAGPWPVDERWWDSSSSRSAHRFQLVDADGTAWLLLLEHGQWWAEARYD